MNHSRGQVVIPIMADIGNALLAVPMVRALKRQLPSHRITILARSDAMGEVFRRLDEVDDVIVTGKGIRGIIRCIAGARAQRPDVYLVPFPSNRWQYAMLALTSGARRELLHRYPVGYWRAMHFVGERLDAIRGLHDVQQNLKFLSLLGGDPAEIEAPVFPLRDEDRRLADQRLQSAGIVDGRDFVAVHAGSAQTVLARGKRWPTERYAQLIDRLQERFGRVLLLEGPDETGVANEILARINRSCDGPHRSPLPFEPDFGELSRVEPHSRGPEYRERMTESPDCASKPKPAIVHLNGPLGTAAAILEKAKLYVGSDSGLAHLAAAVGTPPVTIFAGADPDRVCPFGYRHLVVRSPSEQSPGFMYPWEATCPRIRPGTPPYIRDISIEGVLEKVNLALANEVVPRPAARKLA